MKVARVTRYRCRPDPVVAKYLYLAAESHADTCVRGGMIPIKLASTYLSDQRAATRTPDEGRIYDSAVDLEVYQPVVRFVGDGFRNITLTKIFKDGQKLPDVFGASRYRDDGLILSFCNQNSEAVARRFNRQVCVQILDIGALKRCIDQQIGIKGIMAPCRYTTDHQRNHFLKSTEDAWQQEYRLFWARTDDKERWVQINTGLARRVDIASVAPSGSDL